VENIRKIAPIHLFTSDPTPVALRRTDLYMIIEFVTLIASVYISGECELFPLLN